MVKDAFPPARACRRRHVPRARSGKREAAYIIQPLVTASAMCLGRFAR